MSEVRRFALPDLGEGLTEADIVAWRVQVGDVVVLNQVLVEVESAKAVVELPSPFAGTVVELLAEEGSTVAVGSPLVAIGIAAAHDVSADTAAPRRQAPDGREPVLVGSGPAAPPPSRRRRGSRPDGVGPPPDGRSSAKPLAAPPVRFMARQQGVDLASVTGRGPGGIVTREDLADHLATRTTRSSSGGKPGRETRTPVRGVRKSMAEAMARSAATVPQACVFQTLDVTPTTELVERLRGNPHFGGARVTPLTIVAKAVLVALRDHPALNSSWEEGPTIVTKHDVNLGVAVAAPRGLLVPNIKDAQELTLRDLAAALSALTVTAREGRCTPADLSGGTFTVTNIGVFGVEAGVPIVNPGEAAVLACGAIRARPWEHGGEIALRDVTTLSLAFDHRLLDGQEASLFLAAVGEILADPVNLVALA